MRPTQSPRLHGQQQGFSLLEAIVALVILAGACMALFAWISTSLNQLQRAELYVDAAPAVNSAAQYLKTVDLAQRPNGTLTSGAISVDWQAHAIEIDITRNSAYANSNFLLSLYNVELIPRTKTHSLPSLHTRVVNYRLKPVLAEPNDGF